MSFAVTFELDLPHGVCVGVNIPPQAKPEAMPEGMEDPISHALAALSAEEGRFAETLQPLRRRTWIAGRIAMRAALSRVGIAAGAILPNHRGAPMVPAGTVGSISHKETLAIAMAAADTGWMLGVDIEADQPPRHDISRHVLTEAERAELAGLDEEARWREIIVRFSLKESLYKAIDPVLHRYVGFREVWVRPEPDGGAAVGTMLKSGERFAIDARWTRVGEFVLTSVRARQLAI